MDDNKHRPKTVNEWMLQILDRLDNLEKGFIPEQVRKDMFSLIIQVKDLQEEVRLHTKPFHDGQDSRITEIENRVKDLEKGYNFTYLGPKIEALETRMEEAKKLIDGLIPPQNQIDDLLKSLERLEDQQKQFHDATYGKVNELSDRVKDLEKWQSEAWRAITKLEEWKRNLESAHESIEGFDKWQREHITIDKKVWEDIKSVSSELNYGNCVDSFRFRLANAIKKAED
jgi:predicted  nucleic acid-binding Zn-ribbon protein